MSENNWLRTTATAVLMSSLLLGCASAPPSKPAPTDQPASASPPEAKAESQPVVVKPDYPQEYVVVKGDTLWDIASRFLRDPWRWPEVWQKNPQVENPHLIYPGDVLRLVYIDGKPVIQVQRGQTGRALETVKLSPRVREQALERAIPTIPVDAIRQLLTRTRVVGEKALDDAPYVLASLDEHLIAGGRGQRIFARGLSNGDYANYAIVRRGKPYRDPRDGEVLGYEAIYLARARVLRFGDPARLVIEDSRREVLNGDRLLPLDEGIIDRAYIPHAPAENVQGQIISVMDGVSRIGQYQVVALNLGLQEVEPGNVLGVFQTGDLVRDPVTGDEVRLPRERAGTVMIFRVFDKLSYALVMNAVRAVRVNDAVTNP